MEEAMRNCGEKQQCPKALRKTLAFIGPNGLTHVTSPDNIYSF